MMVSPLLTQWLLQPGGLSRRLAEIQDDAGLTGKNLGELIGYDPANVSRVRNGTQVPGEDVIRRWCWACRADDQAGDLVALRNQAELRHIPWKTRFAVGMEGTQRAYTELYRRATSVWAWGGMYIPGSLQTEEYARAVLTVWSQAPLVPGDVEEAVEQRRRRAAYVGDGQHTHRFVFSEAALMSGPCEDRDLLDQLDALTEAAQRPGVEMRVIPLRGGIRVIVPELFAIYTVDGSSFVITEGVTGEHEWTDPEMVAEYVDLYWRLVVASTIEVSDMIDRAREAIRARQ
jgi:hypothetical protein